jgi:predicted amidohydrolase
VVVGGGWGGYHLERFSDEAVWCAAAAAARHGAQVLMLPELGLTTLDASEEADLLHAGAHTTDC